MIEQPLSQLRQRLHELIFEADTAAGKTFDITLVVCILLSVVVVMLDSVGTFHARWGAVLYRLEWFFYYTVYYQIFAATEQC